MTRAVAFLVFALLAWAAPVRAGFALFQIVEVYSNADGSVQYVVATGSANGLQGSNRISTERRIVQGTNLALGRDQSRVGRIFTDQRRRSRDHLFESKQQNDWPAFRR